MHIPDGVLSPPVLIAAGALTVAGVGVGLRRIEFEHIPRVGLLSAVFFIASLVAIPLPPLSAHLLLNGLIGIMLGWAAFPAILVALFLQAILFGHGGLLALGANTFAMALPAVVCHYIFRKAIRDAAGRGRTYAAAFAAGATGVGLACCLNSILLFASGREFLAAIVSLIASHLPIMLLEGLVVASIVAFLKKAQPQALAITPGMQKGSADERS